ncbi:PASTA domain-containing protein [Streptomyces sp. NPDC001910]|uniref:PASTA domain-containing protein n=1 Tax=Streptomyces sp. NPDC001910 TaxID=3154403 RepID=UPI003317D706
MRTRIIGAILLTVAVGSTVACQPTDDNKSSSTATSTRTGAAGKDKPAERKQVPNFVGMGLQSAQDAAQEQGFFSLKSHDSLGRDRRQAFDRNWKVCSQNYKPGKTLPVDTTLDFGSVKLEESCPARDEQAPSAAGGKMPDFSGKSVKAARAALDSGTSITVEDATGNARWVLIESNWQVCTQTPSPGAANDGQPVVLNAVKFEESCP